jgi:hypothetical protein
VLRGECLGPQRRATSRPARTLAPALLPQGLVGCAMQQAESAVPEPQPWPWRWPAAKPSGGSAAGKTARAAARERRAQPPSALPECNKRQLGHLLFILDLQTTIYRASTRLMPSSRAPPSSCAACPPRSCGVVLYALSHQTVSSPSYAAAHWASGTNPAGPPRLASMLIGPQTFIHATPRPARSACAPRRAAVRSAPPLHVCAAALLHRRATVHAAKLPAAPSRYCTFCKAPPSPNLEPS